MQGEGPYVGRPSVFVRLGGCDLRCAWCDSPTTWRPAERCRIETSPGSEQFRMLDNPISPADVDAALDGLEPRPGDLVSITGGEPLLQPEAVAAIAERVHDRGLLVFLETHGLATEALRDVLSRVSLDVVSMDWKLASDVRREGEARRDAGADFHDEHEAFLAAAASAGEIVVKVVVTPNTRDEEIDEVCRRVARTAPDTCLILQPVTPTGQIDRSPAPAQLLAWHRRCRALLNDVRLIPQTHKMMGAL